MSRTATKRPKANEPAKRRTAAAIYVRHATVPPDRGDDQELSLRHFAARHKMEVVARYADAGKRTSGGQEGLKRMMRRIQSGKASFGFLIMRDLSRWGRFHNPEELVYYENTCRRHGIDVLYAGTSRLRSGR